MKRETMEKLCENGFELCSGGELKLSRKYRAFKGYLKELVSGEGPVGECSYLRLWKKCEIEELNDGYQTQEWVSDIILIGTDGGDEAYGIDKKGRYIAVPFIGYGDEDVEILGNNFDEFIDFLYSYRYEEDFEYGELLGFADEESKKENGTGSGLNGMCIHHITPIIFGGSPTDISNKILVSPEDHKKYTAFWRRVWQKEMEKKRTPGSDR